MARMDRISKGHTKIEYNEGRLAKVQYYATDIVTLAGRRIILNSGGWRTVTTKERMNQTANVFGLGFYVFQKDYAWFVTHNNKTVPFKDGIALTFKGEI